MSHILSRCTAIYDKNYIYIYIKHNETSAITSGNTHLGFCTQPYFQFSFLFFLFLSFLCSFFLSFSLSQYWKLNSGPCLCYTSTPLLSYISSPSIFYVSFVAHMLLKPVRITAMKIFFYFFHTKLHFFSYCIHLR